MDQRQVRRQRRQMQVRRQRLTLVCLLLCAVLSVVFFTNCSQAEREHSGETGRSASLPPDSAWSEPSESAESLPDLPIGYDLREMTERELSEGTLVLVNRDHSFDPSIPRTVTVYAHKSHSYFVKNKYLSVTEEAADALNRWMDAFDAGTGKTDVNVVAGWRSFEDQETLYQNAVETKGQAHADAYLALPGHSEHHTGLAVDLDTYNIEDGTSGGFDGKGAYAWAVEHAWEYGFIQRYPPEKSWITGIDYESWHFRYVGLPHAYIMQTEDLCLEEYVEYLRKYPFSGEHLNVTCLGMNYELYYCPMDQVVVPASGDYAISGNNVDGFIVTLALP